MKRICRFKSEKGIAGAAHLCGLIVITLMMAAICVDLNTVYLAQQNMQNGVDAASLAGVSELYHSKSPIPQFVQDAAVDSAVEYADENISPELTSVNPSDVTLGYVDPLTKAYDPLSFTNPTTDTTFAFSGGYNAVRVRAIASSENSNPLDTFFAQLLGKKEMNTYAYSVAMLDRNVSSVNGSIGLRPIYGCQTQYDLAMTDGNPTNNKIRVYNDHFVVDGVNITNNCPPQAEGNWGFADLRDDDSSAPGNATLSSWWANGFTGNSVNADSYYSTQPGNSISSSNVGNAINSLIQNKTVITIPLIDQDYTGSGSNTSVHVVGFTGMVITGYNASGSASSRYIEGYFVNILCRTGCKSGDSANAGGVAKISLIH